ncbi:uncharacterized protein PHACADRAFT_250945 [Phanerochaete carnosa HHB-10118-sp]|uniref:Uncharacterized protein n=1 Tax=Phanerochaete carnosa (strain HHB-10118-sp) TaxID=650164 RepID=K5VB18_PHACS|nr:uncharacterized protein PHACADRAFT_250945 [Phanerochaete carnosa HHB-10118-sp]EKM60076.1 hypothetical protein PHACADRAFT_250945 [Phanerochaete carnosa HHB-10118-sp]
MRGGRRTLNEIVRLAEKVHGQKFDVTHLSEQQILETINSRSPGAPGRPDGKPTASEVEVARAQLYLQILRSNRTGYEGKNLNELCPQVQSTGVPEFLQQWWGKQQ